MTDEQQTEEQPGWEALDKREPDLLSRLMLDSVLPAALNDGQAIALGVAYAQLDHSRALRDHALALRELAEITEKSNG